MLALGPQIRLNIKPQSSSVFNKRVEQHEIEWAGPATEGWVPAGLPACSWCVTLAPVGWVIRDLGKSCLRRRVRFENSRIIHADFMSHFWEGGFWVGVTLGTEEVRKVENEGETGGRSQIQARTCATITPCSWRVTMTPWSWHVTMAPQPWCVAMTPCS
eukprot:753234-Pelagomonas_calceolata.AAC.2